MFFRKGLILAMAGTMVLGAAGMLYAQDKLEAPQDRDFLGVPSESFETPPPSGTDPGAPEGGAQQERGAQAGAKLKIEDMITTDGDQKKNSESDIFNEKYARVMGLLEQLSPEIREELMGRGDHAYAHCTSSIVLYNFYDCSCYALHVIEANIMAGPDFSYSSMLLEGEFEECASPPLIAGYGYSYCADIMDMRQEDPVVTGTVCRCAADQLLKTFTKNPYPDKVYIDRLMSDAVSGCRSSY